MSAFAPTGHQWDVSENLLNTCHPLLANPIITHKIIICGDLNIDFLNENNTNYKLLKDMMDSCECRNMLTSPTRICTDKNNKTSISGIDYIISNLDQYQCTQSIFNPHLSDHLAVTLFYNYNDIGPKTKTEPTKKHRKVSKKNTTLLKTKLNDIIWNIDNEISPSTNFEIFINQFKQAYNESCPLMPNYSNASKYQVVQDELKQEKNDLDNAFHMYRQSSSTCLERIYKIKRKNYRKSLRNAKREKLNENICSADNKIKQIWREVNAKLGRMNHETRDVHLNINNVEVMDPEIAANCFGEYFKIIEEK
ncbi:hypothetical protein JTB14_000356 [Gonioctena quinquepunctata]|nr:hypothetical protein JTB14_000356 [Gonioctena quinquepunctata]